ncbi:hypothetical protein KI387_022053, partial [Taxus chinensis]
MIGVDYVESASNDVIGIDYEGSASTESRSVDRGQCEKIWKSKNEGQIVNVCWMCQSR